MSKKTVAELTVETLALAGVERVYGLAGDSLNGITDSIRDRNDLREAGIVVELPQVGGLHHRYERRAA